MQCIQQFRLDCAGACGHFVARQHPVGPLADIGPTADRRYPALQRVDIALRPVEFGDPRCDIVRTQIALAEILPPPSSAERRVGKEGVSTCRSRWSPSPSKK